MNATHPDWYRLFVALGIPTADAVLNTWRGTPMNTMNAVVAGGAYWGIDSIIDTIRFEIASLREELNRKRKAEEEAQRLRTNQSRAELGNLGDVVQDDAIRGFLTAPQYRGEAEIYLKLTALMRSAPPRSCVWAVCTRKTWGSKALEAYFQEGVAAVHHPQRAIAITRIFALYEPQSREEARAQDGAGIRTKVIPPRKFEEVSARFKFLPSTGFAIFEGRGVFLHCGIGAQATGSWIESQSTVGVMCDLFRQLEIASSEP